MYRIEWIWPLAPIGVVALLTVPVVNVLVGLAIVLLVAVAILVALVAAIVAMPLLLARAVRRHRRSGRTLPAYTAQRTVSSASLLTAVGRQAAAPAAPGALVR